MALQLGAKSAAGDKTSVFWSYRGDKMPRISKALADAFFAAYVGNGNIRYYRRSEPAAIFTGDDRKEYLAIRVDRRQMEGRPGEITMLEFPKSQVIAFTQYSSFSHFQSRARAIRQCRCIALGIADDRRASAGDGQGHHLLLFFRIDRLHDLEVRH